MNTLLQVLAVLRHLLRAVARRNVLRAVPVKRLQMKKKQTFNAGAIVGRRHLRQQLRVVLCRQDLDGGVDFQPGTARIIHQKQAGPVAAAQIAGSNVLAVTAEIGHRQGDVIQQMQKPRRAAAMLNVGPAALRHRRQIKAVAGGDHPRFAVAEAVGLAATARALNMPLTTVSRHIGELESALGVRLLARTTRKLTLTDAGVDYVAAARRILEEVENAERQATGEYQEPKGELVISAPTMFGRQHVLPVISEFIARYPLIRVRLLLSDRNADLVSDHVDLAVRIGDLADSSMVATRLGTMRIVACAHPALLAKYGEPQRPRDLAALPIIRIESPMPYRGWRFRAAEREDQLINLPPVLSVTTPESAADAARLGVGVARLLHYQALDGLRHRELRLLLENVEPDPAPVHLLYTARDLAPLKLRKFIDFAAPALRQALLRIAGAA